MARAARVTGSIAALVVLVFGVGAIYAFHQASSLDVVPVTDDVYAIHGLGSNVGVLRAGDGVVIVDTEGRTHSLDGYVRRKEALILVLSRAHW